MRQKNDKREGVENIGGKVGDGRRRGKEKEGIEWEEIERYLIGEKREENVNKQRWNRLRTENCQRKERENKIRGDNKKSW